MDFFFGVVETIMQIEALDCYEITQLRKNGRRALRRAADSFVTVTCTPDDGM